MNAIRRKFTYANVMSTVAVFLVLGGATAVAATHLGRNTVGTAQLKANAVTANKIADGSVSSADIKPSSLGGAQLADGSVSSADIQPSSLGGAQIADDSISGAKIQSNSLTGAQIANGSISGSDINSGSLPPANSVAGQKQFSFYLHRGQTVDVNLSQPDEVDQNNSFVIKAVCDSGLLPKINLVSNETDATLAIGEDANKDTVSLSKGVPRLIFGFLLQFEDPTQKHLIAQESPLTAVNENGETLTIEQLSTGMNLDGHPGECFAAGNLSFTAAS